MSTPAYSVISLSTTIGSLLGGFLRGLLPGSQVLTYRWTLVAGTGIAALGLAPMMLMGAARRGRGLPDPTALKEATEPAARRRVREDMSVFVLVGGLMAVGAGMVIPFFNVYLTTIGADSTTVGYIYALAGLSAAVVGLLAPTLARYLGSLYGVAAVRLSIVPFFFALVAAPNLALAAVAYIVRQTSTSMAWPIDSTFISEVLPPRARSRSSGSARRPGISATPQRAWWRGSSSCASGTRSRSLDLIVFMLVAMVVFVVYFARHPRVQSGEVSGALPRWRRRPLPTGIDLEGEVS